MRGLARLIQRCIGILFLSTVLIFLLNVLLLIAVSAGQTSSAGPWTTAEETAQALTWENGGYVLSEEMAAELQAENVWAIYIDNESAVAYRKSSGHNSHVLHGFPDRRADQGLS